MSAVTVIASGSDEWERGQLGNNENKLAKTAKDRPCTNEKPIGTKGWASGYDHLATSSLITPSNLLVKYPLETGEK